MLKAMAKIPLKKISRDGSGNLVKSHVYSTKDPTPSLYLHLKLGILGLL
jgi:hypothetical protein